MRKHPSLTKDQICHNIGIKPSSFHSQLQNVNLPHIPYRYNVTVNSNTQYDINNSTTENTKQCTDYN